MMLIQFLIRYLDNKYHYELPADTTLTEYRKPPKPPHYDSAENGDCRFCGKEILKANGKINFRANWHKDCVIEYKLIHWPKETRKAVWKRDKGRCEGCGVKCGLKGWELDHRKPLIEAKGDITYWMMDNLSTLCHQCHKYKTGSEASARAAARAIQKEQMGYDGMLFDDLMSRSPFTSYVAFYSKDISRID